MFQYVVILLLHQDLITPSSLGSHQQANLLATGNRAMFSKRKLYTKSTAAYKIVILPCNHFFAVRARNRMGLYSLMISVAFVSVGMRRLLVSELQSLFIRLEII